MARELTYKNKNKMLHVGAILMAILSYSISISETVELIGTTQDYKVKIKSAETAPLKIAKIESQLNSLEGELNEEFKQIDFQQLLLEKVSNYCEENQLKLSDFPKPYVSINNNFKLETYRFEVEGSFHSALDLIYQIEERWKFGNSISTEFNVRKNFKTKTKNLYTTIYLQSIKKNDS